MNVELTGTLKVILSEVKINDALSKKEIVITIDEDTKYPQDIICAAMNKKIEILDSFKMGQKVTAKCNLRGNKSGDNKYFNNLQVWDIKLNTK